MSEDFLLDVRKPARYIGDEWNVSKKDFAGSGVKFALCFPDLYEVGMSNLGLRILYGVLNNLPDVACERFFSPALDMENILRTENKEIFSLESKKSIKDFDIIGFSLGYELSYTNVLNILDLGKIPLKAAQRGPGFPLVIAGGPTVINPEPMHEFIDLFLIGEAEEAIVEIIELYHGLKDKFKSGIISKEELLVLLSGIEGVYAPALYEVSYGEGGRINKFSPKIGNLPERIKKRIVKNLDSAYFPSCWIVPYIEIVHDRITLEVMRGCPNQCRFCQARQTYFPLRQRSVKKLLELSSETYKNSGYEEISLAGLSVSDYAFGNDLITGLLELFKGKAVSVSLPSIKPKSLVGNFAALIATIKKTGLTFAPEAASERMRKVLNKDFELENFFKSLKEAYAAGYRRVKLYFMIGLPQEDEEDLDGILEFAGQVSELKKVCSNGAAEINISINTLIPKPHTPFQWLGMESIESINSKIHYLRAKLKNKKLRINFHNSEMSFLEAVLSRGDRRLSPVIEKAFLKGARFDAWEDHFIHKRWQEAFTECGIEPHFYLREKGRDEVLPWDFLDTGVSKDHLLAEFIKAIEIT
ncbi:MAG: TIGR03960 family B12-binding radical SAM protein [Candidatus Omnitrophica bacterium]|jgi:radical SAM family uncharacterized protein|nr:TIGR03960 family B12-binding radical SAM protein [Candidatus Omnitrophota bacterium]